jgi:hypothetical protein
VTRNTLIRQAILLGLLPAMQSIAIAGSWNGESSLTSSLRYNNNPQLKTEIEDPLPSTITLLIAEVEFEKLEPAYNITVTPKIQVRRYREDAYSTNDGEDYFLRAGYARTHKRASLGLNADYDYQNILTVEDELEGSGIIDAPNDNRKRFGISPSFAWSPSQKDSMNAAVSIYKIEHDLKFSNRADSEGISGLISYERAISHRQKIGLSANVYKSDSENFRKLCLTGLDPDGNCDPNLETSLTEVNADGVGLSATYSFAMSERTRINANFGRQTSESESTRTSLDFPDAPELNFNQKLTFTSNQYRLSITSSGERSEWEITALRNVSPSSNGYPSDKQQIDSQFSYRIASNVTAILKLQAYRQKRVNQFRVQENEFLRGDLTVSWRYARNWTLVGLYIYRHHDPTLSVDDPAALPPSELENLVRKAQTVGLSLRYQFK